MSSIEKMAEISAFSSHENHSEIMPTQGKINSNENLGSDPCLNEESPKKNTLSPSPRPYKRNKKMKKAIPSSLPQQASSLPSLDPKYSLSLDEAVKYELESGRCKADTNIDMKALRRTISNRLSAQRYRANKVQQVVNMEKNVQKWEENVSDLKERIATIEREKELLLGQNQSLLSQLESLSIKAKLDDEEIETNMAKIRELRGFAEMVNSELDLSLRPLETSDPTFNLCEDCLQELEESSSSTSVVSKLQIIPNFNGVENMQMGEYNHLNEVSRTIGNYQEEDSEVVQYLNFNGVENLQSIGFNEVMEVPRTIENYQEEGAEIVQYLNLNGVENLQSIGFNPLMEVSRTIANYQEEDAEIDQYLNLDEMNE